MQKRLAFAPKQHRQHKHSPGGGGTPYIRMIGMIVIFLGVVIGDLVFLGVVQAKDKTDIC